MHTMCAKAQFSLITFVYQHW